MNAPAATGYLAIDVGSSRVKLGWFPPVGDCTSDKDPGNLPIAAPQLVQPAATLAVSHENQAQLWTKIGAWLQEHCPTAPPAFVASVHPAALAFLQEVFAGRLRQLTFADLSLNIQVDRPEQVGIDRLLNAVAINRLRQPGRPAVSIDLGTANTVDLIGPDGAFQGGAILPGMSLSASALHTGTAALPQLSAEAFETPPTLVGKCTKAAISSGLYWGTVGAVRELVERISQQCEQTPQIFLTGGGAPLLVEHLDSEQLPVRHVPNLVLSGIVTVAEELS